MKYKGSQINLMWAMIKDAKNRMRSRGISTNGNSPYKYVRTNKGTKQYTKSKIRGFKI